jgi:hypothetical protein
VRAGRYTEAFHLHLEDAHDRVDQDEAVLKQVKTGDRKFLLRDVIGARAEGNLLRQAAARDRRLVLKSCRQQATAAAAGLPDAPDRIPDDQRQAPRSLHRELKTIDITQHKCCGHAPACWLDDCYL